MNKTTARIHDARLSSTFALVTDSRDREAFEAAEHALVAARFDAMDLRRTLRPLRLDPDHLNGPATRLGCFHTAGPPAKGSPT